MDPRTQQITMLIASARQGDKHAAESLLPLVYDELRELAKAKMANEPQGQTIQATALVHEAYLRVAEPNDPGWDNRRHFFAAAAEAMRRILIDRARKKCRPKHGGDRNRVQFEEEIPVEAPYDDVIDVDNAIRKLEARSPRQGLIIKLRYFAGLNSEETAKAVGISLATQERDWRFIKAWLAEELEGDSTI